MSYPNPLSLLPPDSRLLTPRAGDSPHIPPCPDGCTHPFEYVSNQEWCASSSTFPHESLRLEP